MLGNETKSLNSLNEGSIMTIRYYPIWCVTMLLAATLSLEAAAPAAPAENITIAQINDAFVAAASSIGTTACP